MSCKKCEEFQETNRTYYYRWGVANIEIRGCEEHTKEVMEALNEAQEKKEVRIK